MTPRRRRMMFVALILLAVGSAVALTVTALNKNLEYFYDPSAVVAGEAPAQRVFRLGGMVEQGSIRKVSGIMGIEFDVTDFTHEITVRYSGVLPDLFREGQGVIARGKLVKGADGKAQFIAEEVLAKHDEKYMPPAVAESLQKSHEQRRAAVTAPPAVAAQ